MISALRRTTELGLVVLAAIITVGLYTLASLGTTASIPGNVVPFLGLILGLFGIAHIATRKLAPAADGTLLPLAGLLNGVGYVFIARLNDHLAGATAAVAMLDRAAEAEAGGARGAFLTGLRAEIAEDRETLEAVMAANGIGIQRPKLVVAWLAEKPGLLKFNGHLLRRSPLTPFVELETLATGIGGKELLWRALRARAADDAAAASTPRNIPSRAGSIRWSAGSTTITSSSGRSIASAASAIPAAVLRPSGSITSRASGTCASMSGA